MVVSRGQGTNDLSSSWASLWPPVTPPWEVALRVNDGWVPGPHRPRTCDAKENLAERYLAEERHLSRMVAS